MYNEDFWRQRASSGLASPCWSGERWLVLAHRVTAQHAFRRIWPSGVQRVLDVGCGDGAWSAWLMKTFRVDVLGTDALEWPGVYQRIRFLTLPADRVDADPTIQRFNPDLAVLMNSLTCMADWRAALAAAVKVSPRLLCFDNFQTPTPPWWANVKHRQHIEWPALLDCLAVLNYVPVRSVTSDVFHRRLFLKTPAALHPLVAVLTIALDRVAAHTVEPAKARHSAWLFVRRGSAV